MNRERIASELLRIARSLVGDWPEDDDADEGRAKALREFERHVGGEPVEGVMKIGGDWFVFTTELGAYRLARKYRRDWKSLGPSRNYYRGSWYVIV